jgi:rhamnulose-1-phosphate aldolase
LIEEFGEVGQRLREISSAEGTSGNISAQLTEAHLDGMALDRDAEARPLPRRYPLLAGRSYLIKATGRRLWQIRQAPERNLCIVRVSEDGTSYQMLMGRRHGLTPTSEFNSHLGVYETRQAIGKPVSAIIHTQPLHLTALSHVEELQSEKALNRALFRWQPETLVIMPEGIGYTPYLVGGTAELEQATTASLRTHDLVVWAKHGVMSVGPDLLSAFDLIDFAETAARYFYLNRMANLHAPGLTCEELTRLCAKCGVKSPLLEEWLREKERTESGPDRERAAAGSS